MKVPVLFILISILVCTFQPGHTQSAAMVSDPNLSLHDNVVHIAYDILYSSESEKFWITSYSCGVERYYAYILATLYRKKSTSETPLITLLKFFNFALNDSAEALVLLLSKKFRMFM